ncbi:MAG: glycosyltransferase [Burkholderiaceae bacterium]
MSKAGDAPIRVLQLGGPMAVLGAERWILALGRHLDRGRCQTVVGVAQDLPGGGQPPLCEQAARLDLPTAVFEAPGRLSFAAVGQIRAFVRRERIDIVHTHFYKTDLLGALAVRGTGARLLTTPHGWSVNAGLALQLYEGIDRLIFAACDAVAPLSDDLHAGLARLPWVKPRLHMIRNGVDLHEVQSTPAASPSIDDWHRQGRRVIGYIGQLIGRKRIDVLLRAFAGLADQNTMLVLIGDGDQRAALQEQARALGVAERVHFAGFRDDRLAWLKKFDAFVLPSSLEGIPRCLMEAMAARVPIVSSDIPGSRDLITHDATGLLFPLDDHEALSLQLSRILEEPGLAARLIEAAHTRVTREFSAARMADEYLLLYERLLDRPAGSARPGGPLGLATGQ